MAQKIPVQIQLPVSLEQAREMAWRALYSAKLQDIVIDPELNVVSGTSPSSLVRTGRRVTVTFSPAAAGVVASILSVPALPGTIETSAGTKHSNKIAQLILAQVAQPSAGLPVTAVQAAAPTLFEPIASPSGETVAPVGMPVYGKSLAPRMGNTLIWYSIFSVICCPILAPFTLAYCISTLNKYKEQGDPGDRTTVKIALWISIVGCALFGVRLALRFIFQAMGN